MCLLSDQSEDDGLAKRLVEVAALPTRRSWHFRKQGSATDSRPRAEGRGRTPLEVHFLSTREDS